MFCALRASPREITLGRNGKREHFWRPNKLLRQKNVEFHSSDRGGDITYHGPGQLIGYPILNLGAIRKDVVWYVRMLEEANDPGYATLASAPKRVAEKTGVWVRGGPSQIGSSYENGSASEQLPRRNWELSACILAAG